MGTPLKTTPLNKWHRAAGANMADFGGFDMPLWYETGVKDEHLAVLKSAGIFDTSHMACINVNGQGAFDLINYCFTRDIATLNQGRCAYGAFLNTKGQCIDDAIVYKFNDTFFMICVNAGMGGAIAQHLELNKKGLAVAINDLSDKIAKMDIQGINSAKILSKLIQTPDTVFNQMPYFSFKGNFDESEVKLLDSTPVLLSRDSLRAGACLPLSHQDIGGWKFLNHPWDFALPYIKNKSSFSKDFLGADALLSPSKSDSFTYPFIGDSLRKVAIGDKTSVVDDTDDVIGKVLTCNTDMGISWHEGKIVSICSKNLPENLKIKGISCGFVMVTKKLELGTKLTLKEGKREISATIVTDIRPDRTARKKLYNFI